MSDSYRTPTCEEVALLKMPRWTISKFLWWTVVAAVMALSLSPWLRELSVQQLVVFCGVLAFQLLVAITAIALGKSTFKRALRKAGKFRFAGTVAPKSTVTRNRFAKWTQVDKNIGTAIIAFSFVAMALYSAVQNDWEVLLPFWISPSISLFMIMFLSTWNHKVTDVWFFDNGLIVASHFLTWDRVSKAYVNPVESNQIRLSVRFGKLGISVQEKDVPLAEQLIAERFPSQTAA